MSPLVSIIIPVYNATAYVSACLESLLAQRYQNLEIICVNDGSTDDSAKILQNLSNVDSRITLLSQSNQGPSCARNTGLSIASGEYVYFLDSDDKLDKTMVERCVAILEKSQADIVAFDIQTVDETGRGFQAFEQRNQLFRDGEVISGLDFLWRESEVSKQTAVWSYFFRRKLIEANKIRFYPHIIHEDELFHYQFLISPDIQVTYLSEKLYLRRFREGSIMTVDFSNKNIDGYLQACREIFKSKTRGEIPLKKRYCQPICSRFIREFFRHGYSLRFRWQLIKAIVKFCRICGTTPLPFYEVKRLIKKYKLSKTTI